MCWKSQCVLCERQALGARVLHWCSIGANSPLFVFRDTDIDVYIYVYMHLPTHTLFLSLSLSLSLSLTHTHTHTRSTRGVGTGVSAGKWRAPVCVHRNCPLARAARRLCASDSSPFWVSILRGPLRTELHVATHMLGY